MKYLLIPIVLYCSCHSPQHRPQIETEKKDTVLTIAMAEQELKNMRASITDSGFATMLDANLLIQTLEFTLQKADTLRNGTGYSDSLIVNHANGKLLYSNMMKSYSLALNHSKKEADIKYYKDKLNSSQNTWLNSIFHNLKTGEALNAIGMLQKDMVIISMIVNNADSEERRLEIEKQYKIYTQH